MLDHSLDRAARSASTVTNQTATPIFSNAPASRVLSAGSPLELTATADPNLKFQWRKNDANLPGQTNTMLRIAGVSLADEGWYSLAGSNGSSMASTPLIKVTVLPNPASVVTPVEMTGWNLDVIREAAPPSAAFAFSEVSPGTTLQVADGASFFENGLLKSNDGLPSSRTFTSALHPNITFRFQPYTNNNVLKLNVGQPTSALTLTAPRPFSFLSILVASTIDGGGPGEMVINFSDGTSSAPLVLDAPVWNLVSSRMAIGGMSAFRTGRTQPLYRDFNEGFGLHEVDFDLTALGLDTKPITSLTFTKPGYRSRPYITGIFAVSGTPAAPGPILQNPAKTATGAFRFELPPATPITTVESSHDLKNWSRLGSLVNSDDGVTATDPELPAIPHRFFRLHDSTAASR